jgi:hypothetical protein
MSYASTVLATTGLSGYWRLNEPNGTVATDSSANANHGEIFGSPTMGAAGPTVYTDGTSITFNGTDQYVTIPEIDITNKSFSVEAWIKPASADVSNSVWFAAWTANDLRQHLHLWINDAHTNLNLNYYIDDFTVTMPSGFAFDAWNHVVVTYASSTTSLYLNGAFVSSGAHGPFTGASPSVWIARHNTGDYFGGGISDVAVYTDVALNADAVLSHYTVGRTGEEDNGYDNFVQLR